jgi:hypothetical protein
MDGQAHRDSINAQLAGMLTTHTTEGSVTGGSFTFAEPEMKTIIQNWLDLARSYSFSLSSAEKMSRIKPPAEDFASRFHADAANRSGESYLSYLEHNRDYCAQQAQLFQATLDDYLGVEHTNVTEMNKSAPQGPQAGV